MFRSVALKSLWDQRRSLVWWSVGFVAVVLLLVLIYPSIRDPAELAGQQAAIMGELNPHHLLDPIVVAGWLVDGAESGPARETALADIDERVGLAVRDEGRQAPRAVRKRVDPAEVRTGLLRLRYRPEARARPRGWRAAAPATGPRTSSPRRGWGRSTSSPSACSPSSRRPST